MKHFFNLYKNIYIVIIIILIYFIIEILFGNKEAFNSSTNAVNKSDILKWSSNVTNSVGTTSVPTYTKSNGYSVPTYTKSNGYSVPTYTKSNGYSVPTYVSTGNSPATDYQLDYQGTGISPDYQPATGSTDTNYTSALIAQASPQAAATIAGTTIAAAKCKDLRPLDKPNDNCIPWAKMGECTTNPDYMLANCCGSCAEYDKTIARTTKAATIAGTTKAATIAGTIAGTTKAATIAGTTIAAAKCKDLRLLDKPNDNCIPWAKTGECKNNPAYMLVNCCGSCAEYDPQ